MALRGQPADAPLLAPDAGPEEVLRTLLQETEGALARISLAGLASSGGDTAAPQRAEGTSPTYLFELPVLAQGHTSIAQIEIRRDDGRAGDAERAGRTWNVRFSLDTEPLGPVHVSLVVQRDHVAATIWGERPETLECLRATSSEFEAAVAAHELTLDQLVVRGGRPEAPAQPPRHFLDRVS